MPIPKVIFIQTKESGEDEVGTDVVGIEEGLDALTLAMLLHNDEQQREMQEDSPPKQERSMCWSDRTVLKDLSCKTGIQEMQRNSRYNPQRLQEEVEEKKN